MTHLPCVHCIAHTLLCHIVALDFCFENGYNYGHLERTYASVHGDYGITVITPVCGTGYPGSIPGNRPEIKSPLLGTFYFWAITQANCFACARESNGGVMFSALFPEQKTSGKNSV